MQAYGGRAVAGHVLPGAGRALGRPGRSGGLVQHAIKARKLDCLMVAPQGMRKAEFVAITRALLGGRGCSNDAPTIADRARAG